MRRALAVLIIATLWTVVVGCSDDGGTSKDDLAVEAGSDPCDACKLDEVCVQSFDGTCTDLGVACKKVDPICAHRTFPLGTPSSPCELGAWNDGGAPLDGWLDPECDKQYCGTNLQCDNAAPCGSEHASAQVYCYGP